MVQVSRLQQRLDALFAQLGPGASASAPAEGAGAGAAPGRAPPAAAGGQRGRRQPTPREQELLDTVALLKSALERTKKGLESGVPNSKYMVVREAVDSCMGFVPRPTYPTTAVAGLQSPAPMKLYGPKI